MTNYKEKTRIEKEIENNNVKISDYEDKILQLRNKNIELHKGLRQYKEYSDIHTGDLLVFEPSDEELDDVSITCMVIEYDDKYDLVIMKSTDEDFNVGESFGYRCRFIDTLLDEMKDYGYKLVNVEEFDGI